MKVDCETCPISSHCEGYKEAVKENWNSYHPQEVVRASHWDCPLVKLIKMSKEEVSDGDYH